MVFSGFYAPNRVRQQYLGYGAPAGTMLAASQYLGNRFRYRNRTPTALTLVKRRKAPAQSRSFKNKVMNTQPAKHMSGQPAVALLHDNFLVFSPTQSVVQGDTNATRDGDSIYIAALKIKGAFITPNDAGAYTYRIMVVWSGEEVAATSWTLVASGDLAPAQTFLPNTQTQYATNAIANPKAMTVLYDETIDINSQIDTIPDVQSYATTVQINQQFPYQASGSAFGKVKNLYIIVVSSTAGGVDNSTSTGTITMSYDLIFKE